MKMLNEKRMKLISFSAFLASILICVYGWHKGIFTSQETLQKYISGLGFFAAAVFIIFQAVQVVVPMLPGGIACLVGVLLFGPWKGFLYNYLGICIGSILAFTVAKYCGKPVLKHLFSEKMIEKYENWTSKKERFAKWFAVAIFLPVAPDDFLCYLAGTTEMPFSQFVTIILLGKPAAIAMYSAGLHIVFNRLVAGIGGVLG